MPLTPTFGVSAGFDWVWDEHFKSPGALLSCDNRKVNFHTDYSCGTAAIRGIKELADGQHFWEVKMTSPVYGTDMVGGQHANISGKSVGCLSLCFLVCHRCRWLE